MYCIHHLPDFFTNQIGISKGTASKWSTNVYIFVRLSYKVTSNLGILPIYSFFLLDKFGLNNRLLRVVFSVTILCWLHPTIHFGQWIIYVCWRLPSMLFYFQLFRSMRKLHSAFYDLVIKQSLPIYDFLSTWYEVAVQFLFFGINKDLNGQKENSNYQFKTSK